MYLPNPSTVVRKWQNINFEAEDNSFEFRVFILLD